MKSPFRGIKEFLWPSDLAVRNRRFELAFWAFILALAYLPLPLGFLGWIALARPLAIISKLEGKDVFKAAYFYGFTSNLLQLYWVAVVTPAGMVAAIFILSLYPAIILSAFNKLYRYKKALGLIALPFLWVGMEYFRSLTQCAFPWTDLGYSQGYYLTIVQIVSLIGVYGLSFLLVIQNIAIWQLFRKRNKLEQRVTGAIVFMGVLLSVYAYGWAITPPMEIPPKYPIAILQGNVPLEMKWGENTRDWNFTHYDSLAHEAAMDSVYLIVWPETSAPAYPRWEGRYQRMLANTARSTGIPNLIGALDVVQDGTKKRSYNSAFQFDSSGRIEFVYHKNKLVPFSEQAPYQEYLPFLGRDFLGRYLDVIKTRQIQWWSDFSPGDSIVLFNSHDIEYSILICFESAFPDFVRKGILQGAQYMVNITNDTWFGRSPGPFQHMRLVVFRAIENRTWIVRCANSGISAFIDPYGRERVRAGLYEQKVLIGGINPAENYSTFTKTGPIVGQISWLLTGIILSILLIAGIVKRIK